MGDKGKTLPDEKRTRVLEAAVRQFAACGFENASTNVIVKEAGISKGLLFHYFGSKRSLYLQVLDDYIERSVEYFLSHFTDRSPDPVERLAQWVSVKARMYREMPMIYRFGAMLLNDMPTDLKVELDVRYAKLNARLLPLYMDGLDMSVFRDDVDKREALDLILLVANALTKRYVDRMAGSPDDDFSKLDDRLAEINRYLDMLRSGLYKVGDAGL